MQKSENLQIQNDLYEYPLVTYFSASFLLITEPFLEDIILKFHS